MAVLGYLGRGAVTWDDYDRRPYRESRRLARSLIAMHKAQREADEKLWSELFKAFVGVMVKVVGR